MNDQHPLWKPKAIATGFVLITSVALCAAGKLGGGEWVAVVNLALATFSAASVAENKLLK